MSFFDFFCIATALCRRARPERSPRLSGAATTLAASRGRHSQWQSARRGI